MKEFLTIILLGLSTLLYSQIEFEANNINILNAYLKGLMQKHLTINEYQVLRLSYGLDCERHSAKEIAHILGLKGISNHVRVSELKKQAVDSLVDKVDHEQVIDYL